MEEDPDPTPESPAPESSPAPSLDETLPAIAASRSLDETIPALPSTARLDETLPIGRTAASLDETLPISAAGSRAAAYPVTPPTPHPNDLVAADTNRDTAMAPANGVPRAAPGEEWRGNALAASPHARLAALLVPPLEDFDSARAAELCAEVCRESLGDFAPALVLLPEAERRRAQAVAAFALTLFDFARQRGGDGDRLSQINRWEFTLETALAGTPVGQPVFLRLGEEEQRRPFSRDGLDALFAAARRRATVERPTDAAAAERARRELAMGLALLVFGDPASAAAIDLVAALLGVRALLGLGPELASGRCQLPVEELPVILPSPPPAALAQALNAEARRLSPLLLRGARAAGEVPLTFRRSTTFLVLAAERLLARAERAGQRLLAHPPKLGVLERMQLLARARWGAPTGS